ncbi:MAG TPA: hypothetical protein VGI17_10345 [Solirubrobacterales bacterium]|jgi:hypothetical protein
MKRNDEARLVLLSVGQSPAAVLSALRREVGLSDFVLSEMVLRTAQTVRRWRTGSASDDIPDPAISAVDDLRAIVAMLLGAGYEGPSIKRFLQSRNTGLGQDRPLDALRVGVGGFREVERVTECFIAGIAPDSGSSLVNEDDDEVEPAVLDSPPPEPTLPPQPVGDRS